MSKIVFLEDLSKTYDVGFTEIGENQVRLVFNTTPPNGEILLSGFNIINENNGCVMTNCEEYTYIYRTYEDNVYMVELCNNNTQWIKPKSKVVFSFGLGGHLDGEATQYANEYSELSIPTPIADERYVFSRWNPEPPLSGVIDGDRLFVAEFNYVPTQEEANELLNKSKENKILESKKILEEYLAHHPLISSCHGGIEAKYNVTADKQSLMTSNYLKHTLKRQAGLESSLKWNATGEICEVWSEQEFLQLIIEVGEYVEPLVSLQQAYEKQIIDCVTQEEIDMIDVRYDVTANAVVN